MTSSDLTLDSICGGLQIRQRAKGYRFNLDSILLAWFAIDGLPADRQLRVVDLGTGSGLIALLIARWRPKWQVSGVEVQTSLSEVARENAALNRLPVELITADWRKLGTPGRAGDFDLVVCNPPYFTADGGEPSSDPERAAARQELNGTLEENVRAASRLVRGNGSVRFVHTAARLPGLLAACSGAGLGPVRLCFIHPRPHEEAGTVLLEVSPGARRPLKVEPPVCVHDDMGQFLPPIAALLGGQKGAHDAFSMPGRSPVP